MKKQLLGDYQLLEPLKPGSMGQAYLAEHRFLKKPFFLKLLPEEMSVDPEWVGRFEKEVEALSKLDHPHIAKIHNATLVGAAFFLVADPVLNLDQALALNLAEYCAHKGRLSEDLVLRLARQIASALDAAHPTAHGMLKPRNILIQETAQGIHAVLTDFGLSRIIGPLALLSRTYHAIASRLGSSIGYTGEGAETRYAPGPWDVQAAASLHRSFCENFAFLAPEQKIVGNPKATGSKADVYAFGVLLYYLLTMELPEGYFELPSKKNPSLRWNWDLLICRCLQTDPAKRPDLLSDKIEEWVVTDISGTSRPAKTQAPKPVLNPQEIARPAFEPDPGAIFQVETTIGPYKPAPSEEKTVEPLLTDMAVIPAGTYLRGSNHGGRDEMPRHAIHLHSFALDTHPVMNEQFVRFLEAMGGEKDCNNNDIIRLRDSRIRRSGGQLLIESGYAKHPVVGVTWYGAVAYAKWVGKRLPTEAEWEIASYGGKEDALFPTGNTIERSQANFFSSDTTPVMSYAPNEYGLYDMAGNVYEWCQDWYDYHYYDVSVQEPNDPKGPQQGVYRVLRGGCWKSSREDMRCAHRHRNNPGLMNGTYGFRCAADVSDD